MTKTEKEIVFDIRGLKLFLGHVRHVKATRYEGLKKASNVCACLLILNTVAFIRAVFHNNAHYTDVNGCTVTLTADHFRKIMSGKQPETL